MSIPREQWLAAREDYIRGRGSLASVAARHHLKRGSVEKCAKREGWAKLRREFETAQLAKLIPPPPTNLPPVPVAPDGSVSSAWLAQRQELYYRENAALVDKVRALLSKRLADENEIGTDGLAKITSAIGGIVDAEGKMLGLNHRQRSKPRRSLGANAQPIPEPEAA